MPGGHRSTSETAASWRQFWNSDHSIYVGPRHRPLHNRLIAQDISDLIPYGNAMVLDYGCGQTAATGEVAEECGALLLCDVTCH